MLLAHLGKMVRLGNVRCVSSRRGWWTRQVKDEISSRGGGGWMVGKVNVGKSSLFGSVFPKGAPEGTVTVSGREQRQVGKDPIPARSRSRTLGQRRRGRVPSASGTAMAAVP